MKKTFSFSATVGVYPGPIAWAVVALPKKDSSEIAAIKTAQKKSWNFFTAKTKIGSTSWISSLWPKRKIGLYLIVIKKEVLRKEGIAMGDTVHVTLSF
ncbi:MAG: DUF1905 domain-containing protein [Patescibacteria group bacterium]